MKIKIPYPLLLKMVEYPDIIAFTPNMKHELIVTHIPKDKRVK